MTADERTWQKLVEAMRKVAPPVPPAAPSAEIVSIVPRGTGGRRKRGCYRHWTGPELTLLEQCVADGKRPKVIYPLFRHSPTAVRIKICRLRKRAA